MPNFSEYVLIIRESMIKPLNYSKSQVLRETSPYLTFTNLRYQVLSGIDIRICIYDWPSK